MHRYLFPLIALTVLIVSTPACQTNERPTYQNKSAVYFSDKIATDSLVYSFASGVKDVDTLAVPIKIIGQKTAAERSIKYEIDPASTAVQGKHYELLSPEVTLPPNSIETTLKIRVMSTQSESDVKIKIHLLANDDFDLGYEDRLSNTLIITNQLVKPTYWESTLSLYFGKYTKAKHRLIIRTMGSDFPEKLNFRLITAYMSYGRLVYSYLTKSPIWDKETNEWVMPDWSPL